MSQTITCTKRRIVTLINAHVILLRLVLVIVIAIVIAKIRATTLTIIQILEYKKVILVTVIIENRLELGICFQLEFACIQ